MEALFEQALWLQQRGGASADGAVSLLYQYATVQYVRWGLRPRLEIHTCIAQSRRNVWGAGNYRRWCSKHICTSTYAACCAAAASLQNANVDARKADRMKSCLSSRHTHCSVR